MPTLNWVFKNQPIMSGILTQLSSKKQLPANEKDHWKSEANNYLYIHLYYRSVAEPIVLQFLMKFSNGQRKVLG